MWKPDADDAPPFKNAAQGRPVIYLDYDGVLHPSEVYVTKKGGIELRAPGHSLFECAPILVRLLEPHPEVRIVLSTSWARVFHFLRAKSYLPKDLVDRVIGSTFHRRLMVAHEFGQLSRGEQILCDARRRGAGDWVALDDDDEGWPPSIADRLIKCDPDQGLLDPQLQDALAARLESMSESYGQAFGMTRLSACAYRG